MQTSSQYGPVMLNMDSPGLTIKFSGVPLSCKTRPDMMMGLFQTEMLLFFCSRLSFRGSQTDMHHRHVTHICIYIHIYTCNYIKLYIYIISTSLYIKYNRLMSLTGYVQPLPSPRGPRVWRLWAPGE